MRRRIFVLGLFLLLLAGLLVERGLRSRVLPAPDSASGPVPTPSLAVRSSRPARLAQAADFGPIEAQLKADRTRLARCLMQDPRSSAGRVRLILSWEGRGTLSQLQLDPPVAAESEACVRATVEAWKLGPTPGFQPFRYEAVLALSG